MTKTNFIEADVIKNQFQGQMELDLPNITYDELPCVSVLTLTYKRKHFFQLMWNNWNNYKYPKDKIEWVIIDDSPDMINDLSDIIPKYPNIHYIRCDKHMSVGAKRNFGVECCNYDYIVHQDDDDYYFPDSILAKVRILKRYPKCGCCFSNSLSAYNIMNNISYVMDPQVPESCLSLPEATMMYKRSFWEKQKFPSDHFGEGKAFVIGREKKFVSIPCIFNMIAFTHSRNMTGLARSIETKSVSSETSLANYYNLFDGVTKNIIRKIAKLTNQELKPTKYNRIFCYHKFGTEISCNQDTCITKYHGKKEMEILSKFSNWITINSVNDLDKHAPITDDDLILVSLWFSQQDMDKCILDNFDKPVTFQKSYQDCEMVTFLKSHQDLINHSRTKIFLYNSWECRDFLNPYNKSKLCKFCINYLGISLDKVIVATTDFLNPLVHSLSPQIIGYDFPYLYAKANFSNSLLQTTHSSNRTKAICMFTRRGSVERTAAALFLYSFHREKVAMTYLTIDDYSEEDIKKYGVICSKYSDFKTLLPILPTPQPTLQSTPAKSHTILSTMQTLSLNNEDVNNSFESEYSFDTAAEALYGNKMVQIDWESVNDIHHMISESFIMFTIETNAQKYQNYCQQVSEKTYKAISMGMPFINFTAQPGILKHLKSIGFKTFSPIICEEYDYPTVQERTEDATILQKQYYDRFRKLLKELNRICKMTKNQLIELWSQCQPIVQHNINILKSLDPTCYKSIPIIEK